MRYQNYTHIGNEIRKTRYNSTDYTIHSRGAEFVFTQYLTIFFILNLNGGKRVIISYYKVHNTLNKIYVYYINIWYTYIYVYMCVYYYYCELERLF